MTRLIVALFFLLTPLLAWAQWVPPDDRYKGYPRELVQWMPTPPTAEQLQACVDAEGYEPTDLHLVKYADRVKVASVYELQTDQCRWELTAHSDPAKRYRLVMRRKGTLIARDEQGRDLFDYGSPNGPVCKNPTPYGWPVNLPPTVAVVPVVPMPIREQLRAGIYIPKYEEPEDDVVVVPAVLVPQNKGGICSGKKGVLCAVLIGGAACIIGQVANHGVCGIRFSSEDAPPSNRPPTPRPPPPPNTTPAKPPG